MNVVKLHGAFRGSSCKRVCVATGPWPRHHAANGERRASPEGWDPSARRPRLQHAESAVLALVPRLRGVSVVCGLCDPLTDAVVASSREQKQQQATSKPRRSTDGAVARALAGSYAEERVLGSYLHDALESGSCEAVLTSWEPEEDEDLLPCAATIGKSAWVKQRATHTRRAPTSILQGFATAKGPMKQSMQDYFVAVSDRSGASLWSMADSRVATALRRVSEGPFCLTGVFDGHGAGDHAARTAQESTLQDIAGDADLLASLGSVDGEDGYILNEPRAAAVTSAFRAAFARLDERIISEGEQRGLLVDGTTALVSLQLGSVLYTANAGDSRAVLCRDGAALRLSRDHKPELLAERRRIEEAGGRVANVRGTWRVILPLPNGTSAKVCSVSRGLGDRDFKAQNLIVCEPDVAALVLQPHRDAFAIHASDGLWGHVIDQDAVDAVLRVIQQYSKMRTVTRQNVAAAAARELVRLAHESGSIDDVTVVVTLYEW